MISLRISVLAAGLWGAFFFPLPNAAVGQTPQPGSSPDSGEEQTLETGGDESKAGTVGRRQRYYLGPGQDADKKTDGPWATRPADQAPTSILIGPYVPERTIALPDSGQPASSAPSGNAADIGDTAPSGLAEQPLDDDIAIDRLARLDPAAIGVWTDDTLAPFPVSLWRGSRRATLEALIPALPETLASPTIKSLFRRLLLSPASVPSGHSETDTVMGADPTGSPFGGPASAIAEDMPAPLQPTGPEQADISSDISEASGSLLLARLERLFKAGLLKDFLALADHLTAETGNEPIAHMHADALLVAGDYDTACTIARTSVGQSGAAYWLRMIAMCEALNGRRGATYLQLALLDDTGESNAVFNGLAERLLSEIEGRPTDTAQLPDFSASGPLTPTLFALFRLTGIAIPPALAVTAPPILLISLTENPDIDPDTRLILAERAARSGLLDGETLAGIYTRFTFSDAQRQAVFASLEAENGPAPDDAAEDQGPDQKQNTDESALSPALVTGPRLDALLWQQAANATSAADRIRWIEIALEHSRKKGLTTTMAAALRDPLMAIDASMSLGGYADSAGRIHLLNGDIADAIAWYEAARLAAEAGNSDAKRALNVLWPLLAIADDTGTIAYDADRLTHWWQAHRDMDPDNALVPGDRFFTRLADLGKDVPPSLTDAVMAAPSDVGATPPATLWRQMLDAIRGDRLGETVLTGLVAISNDDLAQTSPALLSAIITGLRLAGLENDARRLAFEAMIADGF